MLISEVRVKLVNNKDNRLRAFCSVTLNNEFVIHDIKIIKGAEGHFVAMPSRKLSDHCEGCGGKNYLQSNYCNNCGMDLPNSRKKDIPKGYAKSHLDIAHPITAEFRQILQATVFDAFQKELRLYQHHSCARQ